MATPKILRPLLRQSTHPQLPPQRRTFLSNPFAALAAVATNSTTQSTPQVLTACRTLPYPSAPVYSIIADVPSYGAFLPYCQRSTITKWSAPDPIYHRRWPSEGLLTSGYGSINETFASRVYCVPGRFVESVGGATTTSLKPEDVAHHLAAQQGSRESDENALLTHLRSKWSIEAMENNTTQVSLAVEFAFSNPLYAALSGNVAPKVADFMIRAFEKRVQEVLERNPGMVTASLGEMDGSALKK